MRGPADLRTRWRASKARAAALLLDAGVVAYAGWCVGRLAAGDEEPSFPSRFPFLLLAAPALALLWQASGRSLGQRAYGIETVADGAGAGADRRAMRSLLALGGVAALVAPFLLLDPAPAVLAAALVLAGLLALPLLDARGRSLAERAAGVRTAVLSAPPAEVRPWYLRPNAWVLLLLLALTLAVGGRVTELSLPGLFEGVGKTRRLWGEILSPDWSIADEVAGAMVETVFLALMASVLALPFAFALGFLGAQNLMGGSVAGRLTYGASRLLMNVVRSVEPLFWAIVFVLWVGVGPFAGMLALLVHSAASLGKLYSEAVEAADPGPVEAIRSTGASALQVIRYGVVPQVVPAFLSFTVYRWDINVRMATILGLVGGGGIGPYIVNAMQFGAWSKLGTILLFVTVVVWLLDLTSARARRRIV